MSEPGCPQCDGVGTVPVAGRAGTATPCPSCRSEVYWGGWTEHGELLHLAATSIGSYARSVCGRVLTGGSYDVPEEMGCAKCHTCLAIEVAGHVAVTDPSDKAEK